MTPRRCFECHRVVAPDSPDAHTVRVCSLPCLRRLTKVWAIAVLEQIASLVGASKARDLARAALKKEGLWL